MISLLEEALQFEEHREDNKNIYFKKDGIFFAKKMQDIVYIKSSAGKMLVKRSGIRWKSVTNPIVRYFVNSIQKILLSAIVQLS